MPVLNADLHNPCWLTDEAAIKAYADKVKMEIALAGTGGDKDALNQTIFIVVHSKMCGAKNQHTLSTFSNSGESASYSFFYTTLHYCVYVTCTRDDFF